MTDTEIKVQDFIKNTIKDVTKHFGGTASDVDPDVNLVGKGILDSLGFVTLMSSIEQNFDIELDFGGADPERFTTIQGLVECTVQALGDKG